ncbi:MAG: type II toxin-antitoxin system HicA family toxin [Candidatus Bipolaricaulia bacterium]
MPPRSPEVQRALEKLGFVRKRQKGSEAIYAHPDGRWTTVPIHSRELKAGLYRAILKQIGSPKKNLRNISKLAALPHCC